MSMKVTGCVRLCFLFVLLQIREAELSQVRDRPTFLKTHVHSRIHQSPETPATEPKSPYTAAALFLFGTMMISSVFSFLHLFQMSHDVDQTALGIERPKTGMFTFDKSARKKQSCCLSSCSHPRTHVCTP